MRVASEAVAHARPDGYTFLLGTAATHGVNPALYPRLSFDVRTGRRGAQLIAHALKHKRGAVVQPAIQATAPIANEIRADPRRYGFTFDLIEAEKTFDEPTLIIARRRDTTMAYRDAWSILDSYPRATFVALDRADHGWPMETPSLLPALIDDWLVRIALAERGA